MYKGTHFLLIEQNLCYFFNICAKLLIIFYNFALICGHLQSTSAIPKKKITKINIKNKNGRKETKH